MQYRGKWDSAPKPCRVRAQHDCCRAGFALLSGLESFRRPSSGSFAEMDSLARWQASAALCPNTTSSTLACESERTRSRSTCAASARPTRRCGKLGLARRVLLAGLGSCSPMTYSSRPARENQRVVAGTFIFARLRIVLSANSVTSRIPLEALKR